MLRKKNKPLINYTIAYFSSPEEPPKGNREKRVSNGNRPHADLVKWQGVPLRAPLLKLPPDLAPLALECFECVLRYCGDLPPDPELTEVKCVYTVLMVNKIEFNYDDYFLK